MNHRFTRGQNILWVLVGVMKKMVFKPLKKNKAPPSRLEQGQKINFLFWG
jgi:hypothetical protein